MSTLHLIDDYLNKVDKELFFIDASIKAQIIKELEQDIRNRIASGESIENILKEKGSAKKVASSYLANKGLAIPRRGIVAELMRSFFYGLVILLTILVMITILLIWRFSPLITIEGDKITLLGGEIMIDEKTSKLIFKKMKAEEENGDIRGSLKWKEKIVDSDSSTIVAPTLKGKSIIEMDKQLNINFSNGVFTFITEKSKELSWHCQAEKDGNCRGAHFEEDMLKFALDTDRCNCEIRIPYNTTVYIKGKNGIINLDKPLYNAVVRLHNGMVNFYPDKEEHYKYNFTVKNGILPSIKSSPSKEAYEITIFIYNGSIKTD